MNNIIEPVIKEGSDLSFLNTPDNTEPNNNDRLIEIAASSARNTDDDDAEAGKGKEGAEKEKPAPVVDEKWSESWKTKFPDYENEEVLKSSLSELKKKADEADLSIADYKKQLEDAKKAAELDPELARIKTVRDNLAKENKKFDGNVWAQINKDYSKITDRIELAKEGIVDEHPDWTKEEIELELESRYRISEWGKEKDENGEEVEGTKNKVQAAMEARLQRESEAFKNNLTEKQKKYSLKHEPSEEEIKLQGEAAQKAIDDRKNLETFVDTRAKKLQEDTLKQTIEFTDDLVKQMNGGKAKVAPIVLEGTKEENEKAVEIFKEMGLSGNPAFWKHFLNKDGKLDEKGEADAFNFIKMGLSAKRMLTDVAANHYKAGVEFQIATDKKADPNRRRQTRQPEGQTIDEKKKSFLNY